VLEVSLRRGGILERPGVLLLRYSATKRDFACGTTPQRNVVGSRAAALNLQGKEITASTAERMVDDPCAGLTWSELTQEPRGEAARTSGGHFDACAITLEELRR